MTYLFSYLCPDDWPDRLGYQLAYFLAAFLVVGVYIWAGAVETAGMAKETPGEAFVTLALTVLNP